MDAHVPGYRRKMYIYMDKLDTHIHTRTYEVCTFTTEERKDANIYMGENECTHTQTHTQMVAAG